MESRYAQVGAALVPREWDEQGREIAAGQTREWDEQGRPVSEARNRRLTRNYTPTAGAVASLSQGATFGFSDEIEGGMEALRRGGTEALRFGPDWASRVGRAASEGYNDARDTTRLFVERNRQEAPIASAVNEIGGALFTGGSGGGRAVMQQGAQRGLPLLANQMARGATVGGASGAAYGFGTGEGGLSERLDSANQGAATGAAFGAAAPAVVNAARPVLSAAGRMVPSLRVDPNRLGTAGGNLTLQPRGQPPQRLPGPVAGTVDRLANRARMTPDQVETALGAARRNPQGEVLSDIFGEPGRQTTRALAQWPGQTGQRVGETLRTRGAEQPVRIMSALRRGLNVSETRQQAIQRLTREYRQASAETYQPLFATPPSPERLAALEQGLRSVRTSPTIRRAVNRARELFNDERAARLVRGRLSDNQARYAHYIKLALDDIIASGRRDGSLVGNQRRATIELRNRISSLLDEALPPDSAGGGYAAARARWGGIAAAEDALDEGADFLTMLPDEVRMRMFAMTDFERMHARIGLVDEITRGMRGGRVVGNRNVANALDYRDTQEVIAAAFDSPEQAADFLDTLNTSNQLMRNATTWGGGSSTAANAAYGADEALNVAGDMAGDIATGRPGTAAARGIRGAINTVTGGAIERANNQRGEALLTRIDTPDAEEFGRQVVAELRRRAAARGASTQASQAVARGGGVGVNRRRD